MSYLALLVEKDHFKKIEVFFLIVGHTHASIDQYFSRLAKAIYRQYFIGSPLSLEDLLTNLESAFSLSGRSWEMGGDNSNKQKPLLVRKISVIFDMKTEMDKHINQKIKYHPLPHVFLFEKWHGVATMQYKMFSTHNEYLPRRPNLMKSGMSVVF